MEVKAVVLSINRSSKNYSMVCGDALEWLKKASHHSIHAVVTDPPYGLIEYKPDQLQKLRGKKGGVWRIPPSFDGCQRTPLPRFTVLTEDDKNEMKRFFWRLANLLRKVLVPGGHVFIATNPLLSYLVYEPFISVGFEKRGEIARTTQTLRGGTVPKMPIVNSLMFPSCPAPVGNHGDCSEIPAKEEYKITFENGVRAHYGVFPRTNLSRI